MVINPLVLLAAGGSIYIDEGILKCADSGSGPCSLSMEFFHRGSEYLIAGRYDSAYIYFRRSFESIRDVDLPLWKAYLLYLIVRVGVKQSYIVDYRFPDSVEISRYVSIMDTLSGASILEPLFIIAKEVMGVHVMHRAPVPDTVLSYFSTSIRSHRRVPVYVPYAEFTLDTILTPYLNSEILTTNRVRYSMNLGVVSERDMEVLRDIFRSGSFHLRMFYFSVMGRILAQRGYFESARSHVWHVEKLVDSVEYGLARAMVHNNLGDIYLIFIKDPIRALRHYRSSLEILDSMGIHLSKTYATVCNNLGMAYHSAGEPGKGVAMLRRALGIQMEIVGGLDAEASNIMSNMARAFEDMGMYDSAIAYTLRTIRLRERIYGKNSDQVLLKVLELAELYIETGDTSEAMRSLSEAQGIRWSPSRSLYPSSYIYRKFYEIHDALGRKDSAYFYLKLILSDSSSLQAAYYPRFLLKLVGLRLSMGDAISVDSIALLLHEALTRLRSLRFTTPHTRRFLLESMLDDLSASIALMVRRGVPAGAIIMLSEYFKGRLLMDEVEFSSDGVVDSLMRLLYSMSGRGAPIEDIIRVEVALDRRKWELGKRFRMDSIPSAGEGNAMLGFVVTDSFLISYLLSRSDTAIRMIPVVRDSLYYIVRKVVHNPGIRVYSRKLYELTLAPWEDYLMRYRRVALSLHDSLRNVVFHALYTGEDYVVEHPYLTYRIFSFYSYDEPCRIRGPVLAIGENFLASASGVGKLVYAEREATRVMDVMNSADGLHESKGAEGNLERYQLLHFATHIVVDDTPRILLRDRAGNIHSIDIFHVLSTMRVGDAVVLSGCRSGEGRPINGWEGLMSLTRAFVYSGARCVVASMREVNDLAAYVFMDRFYRALKEGKTMDIALREAALYMLGNTGLDSPVYWGMFTLTVFRR